MNQEPYFSEGPNSTMPVHAVYFLYALSFFIGITSIIGVIVAHVKSDSANSSFLESHYSWQIRTFWWGIVWGAVGLVLTLIFVGWIVLGAAYIWMIYRVVKGWLRLMDKREV